MRPKRLILISPQRDYTRQSSLALPQRRLYHYLEQFVHLVEPSNANGLVRHMRMPNDQ